MSNPRRPFPILLVLAALAVATVPSSTASAPVRERYVAALEAARGGNLPGAVARLRELAGEAPASVPIHRDLARLTLLLARERPEARRDLYREFRRRLRRTARDVGANVGMAILEEERGRRAAAHRHLLTALTAGCRDPLLVPLLLRTSPSPDGLLGWLARRRAVIPGDSSFRALEARALLARDRVRAARRLLEEGLRRDPEHPDLLALEAALLRAAGREARACEAASIALGFLAAREEVPESRIPLRVLLARVLADCGRTADAEAVVATLGPPVTPPGGPPLEPLVDLGRAETALAREDPLRALLHLGFRPGDGTWLDRFPPGTGSSFAGLLHPREWARGLAARALVALAGLPGARRALPGVPPDPPSGLALADREELLAAVLAAGDPLPGTGMPTRLARALGEAGLENRALRLRVLAAYRGMVPPPALAELPSGDPDLRLAREIAAHRNTLPADSLDELALARAHGLLRASWRTGRTLALLGGGEAGAAAEVARAGLLDLEEAARTTRPLPGELRPLLAAWGRPALVLPGAAARARLAGQAAPADTCGALVRDLGRAARAWSRIESPWPRSLGDLAVPDGACLVLATPPGPGGIVAAIGPGGPPVLRGGPGELDPLRLPPCREARVILWAGPAAPESRGLAGLGRPGGPVLVRVPHPGTPVLPAAGPSARHPGPPVPVGPGPARPLRILVEGLVDHRPPAIPPSLPPGGWPAWTGAGLAPPGVPASVGWLAPPSLVEGGFVAPEGLRPLEPRGPGLVVLGLTVPPRETEEGAWLIAESALLAGRHWALLSRAPLTTDEVRAVTAGLGRAAGDPFPVARHLLDGRPELASRLELWTVVERVDVPPGQARWPVLLGGSLLAALAVLAVVLRALRRRRGPREGPVSPSR